MIRCQNTREKKGKDVKKAKIHGNPLENGYQLKMSHQRNQYFHFKPIMKVVRNPNIANNWK